MGINQSVVCVLGASTIVHALNIVPMLDGVHRVLRIFLFIAN